MLINKFRKHIYESAFMDGVRFYKKDPADDKTKSAQKTIRVAKAVIALLTSLIKRTAPASSLIRATESLLFTQHVQSVSKGELTKENLDGLFSSGDRKTNEVLELIYTAASSEEENGAESSVSKVQ